MAVDIYSPLPGDGLEPVELELFNQINTYRTDSGLPPIPYSPALTLVANRHVWDLHSNIGYLTHDWSDITGPAAYWYAPQRLGTAYPGIAFENAYWTSGTLTAAAVLNAWQNSPSHNAVLLNLGSWADNTWSALGVGIFQNYAVMWVGEAVDPTAEPAADRAPIDLFNASAYLQTYPDVAAAVQVGVFTSARAHLDSYGFYEGRRPSLLFDPTDYLSQHDDLIAAGLSPKVGFEHFQQHGLQEGRPASAEFDPVYYLNRYGDLQAAGLDYAGAYFHFQQYGIAEGRAGAASFDVGYYLARYSDLQAAGFDHTAAFIHYLQHGQAEGRAGTA